MTPRQLLQTPAGQSRMACYSPISSDDEMDEIEEGFVFLGDEVFARWDDDQNKYVPATALQSVVSTARYSWNALSLSPLVSRLGTIGAAVAGRLAMAVNGLRPQAADEISAPVPKALNIRLDDFDDWEHEENIDDGGRVHNWRSNEGAKNDMKYSRNESNNGPYTDTEHRICNCHDRSPQEHNLKLQAQGECGPRFQQEEQIYEPLGVSTMWQRAVKQEESKKRKQLLLAQWQGIKEKGAYQKHPNTWADAGMPSSAERKSTHTARKNEETNQQMRTPICAHTVVHGEVKGRNSVAGMQRDAHVTISLPRSKQVTVQRSSTKRRAGSSVFYGLCAQLRAAPSSHENTVEVKMPDRWEVDIEHLRFCN